LTKLRRTKQSVPVFLATLYRITCKTKSSAIAEGPRDASQA